MITGSRDVVISYMSKIMEVVQISPTDVAPPTCNEEICTQVNSFRVEPKNTVLLKRPSVAAYGAQLDSYPIVNGQPIDPITSLSSLRPTWQKFRTWPLPVDTVSINSPYLIKLVSVSPLGTKKLGMDSPAIFLGEQSNLEVIQFLYSLYNIHFYLIIALSVLFLGFLLAIGGSPTGTTHFEEIAKKTAVIATASIMFSGIFNDIFIILGAPIGYISNFPQLFWGPAIFLCVLPRGRVRTVLISLWCARVIACQFDWQYRDFLFYQTYRWSVVGATAAVGIAVIKLKDTRRSLPFLLLMAWDASSLLGLIPVKSAMYLSPLGFFGLYTSLHLNLFRTIYENHKHWYERRKIALILEKMRAQNTLGKEQWVDLLGEFCRAVGNATNARRVGICYLGFDSPLILTLSNDLIKQFEDRQLPPIYARVIQTKQPLWWATTEELATLLPGRSLNRKDIYRDGRAIVVPILVGDDAYGAVALTDFEDLPEILSSEDRKAQIELTISSFLDMISGHVVRKREVSSSHIERQSNDLISTYSQAVSRSNDKNEVANIFLMALTETIPVSAMYFSYDPGTERLHLENTSRMHQDQVTAWREIPFRARPTNRTSPFAISINEHRSVFVEDIHSFFNFLTPQSVDVLEASRTKGFVSAPVIFGDRVLGLVALLDRPGEKSMTTEVPKILDLPLRYFAYELVQSTMAKKINLQDRALSRFTDPRLTSLVLNATANELAIGGAEPAVIIIQDLRGSTEASRLERDAHALATKLARIYDKTSKIAESYNASYEKCNGDGTVTTMPSSTDSNGRGIELSLRLLTEVHAEAQAVLGVRASLVCVHRGQPFRGILGTTRRVAWDICGADIVDTFAIEKAAKSRPGTVLAISEQIVELEPPPVREILNSCATGNYQIDGITGSVRLYNSADAAELGRRLKIIWGTQTSEAA